MDIDAKVIAYAKIYGIVSVPQLQIDLGLTYSQARGAVARLARQYYFIKNGDLTFQYCGERSLYYDKLAQIQPIGVKRLLEEEGEPRADDVLGDAFLKLPIEVKDIIVNAFQSRPFSNAEELKQTIRRNMDLDDDETYETNYYFRATEFVGKIRPSDYERIKKAVMRRLAQS